MQSGWGYNRVPTKAWFVAVLIFNQAVMAQADEKTIAQWSGVGMQATRPFHLDGPGELQWQMSGDLFQAMMYKIGNDKMPDIVANQIEAGLGTYYIPNGGDYYIKFNAMGKWSARVVALSSSAPVVTGLSIGSSASRSGRGLFSDNRR